VEEGFNIASRLREAGYVAELYLGGREPANLEWALDVQSRAPLFVLTDIANHKRIEIQTITKVLKLLGEGEGVNKNSIT